MEVKEGKAQLAHDAERTSGPYWSSKGQAALWWEAKEQIHKWKDLCNADFDFSLISWRG